MGKAAQSDIFIWSPHESSLDRRAVDRHAGGERPITRW